MWSIELLCVYYLYMINALAIPTYSEDGIIICVVKLLIYREYLFNLKNLKSLLFTLTRGVISISQCSDLSPLHTFVYGYFTYL